MSEPYSKEELAEYEKYISKFSDQEAVTDERHMIIRFLATIQARDAEIAGLKELLKEVMEWIDNWDPNFADDDEWPEVEARLKAAV